MGKLLSDQVLKPSEQGYRRAVNRKRDSKDSHNSKKLKGNRDGQQKVQVGRITDMLQTALSADGCGPGERAGVRQQEAMTGPGLD